MKEYSQLQKFFSVLMIFILLIQLSGCVSYRVISNSGLPDYSKYNHIVHSKNSKYPIENVVVSQGMLSGKVNFSQSHNRIAIRLYPYFDSMIKIDSGNILNLPIDDIAKVKVPKVYVTKDYVTKNHVHQNKSKEKAPISKVLYGILFMCAGASLYYGISSYIESHRHH